MLCFNESNICWCMHEEKYWKTHTHGINSGSLGVGTATDGRHSSLPISHGLSRLLLVSCYSQLMTPLTSHPTPWWFTTDEPVCIPVTCSSQVLTVRPPTAVKTGGLQNSARSLLAGLLSSNSQPLCNAHPHQTFSSKPTIQLLLILRNPFCYSQKEEEATLFSLKLTRFSLNQDWQTQIHRSPARKE